VFLCVRAFELRARAFAEDRLRQFYGDGWWEQGIPSPVREFCETTRRKAETALARNPFRSTRSPRSNFDYLDFSHLAQIFTVDRNWRDIFQKVFGERPHLDARLQEMNEIRNDAYHARTVSESDCHMVELFARQFNQIFSGQAQTLARSGPSPARTGSEVE
jgi:hypothetical protein